MEINMHQEHSRFTLYYTTWSVIAWSCGHCSDIWKVGLLPHRSVASLLYLTCFLFLLLLISRFLLCSSFPLINLAAPLLPPSISPPFPGPDPSWQRHPSWVHHPPLLPPPPDPRGRITPFLALLPLNPAGFLIEAEKRGDIILTASELAICLPLNLPTLPSTALLGTVPSTRAFFLPSSPTKHRQKRSFSCSVL